MVKSVLWCTGHDLIIENVTRAGGCFLHDQRGKKYMDLESGVWITPLGHNHPRINRVIMEQLESIMHTGYCYSNSVVEEASRAILEISGLAGGNAFSFLPAARRWNLASRFYAKYPANPCW